MDEKQHPYSLIHSLRPMRLETLKTYIVYLDNILTYIKVISQCLVEDVK